jgi:hypothetical protein
MEMKITLRVPEAYLPLLEDIRLLQSDSCNPIAPQLSSKSKSGLACKSTVGPFLYFAIKTGFWLMESSVKAFFST